MDFPQQYIMYVSRLIALISISSRLFGVPTWHGMPDQLATRFRVARTEEGMLAWPRSGHASIPSSRAGRSPARYDRSNGNTKKPYQTHCHF